MLRLYCLLAALMFAATAPSLEAAQNCSATSLSTQFADNNGQSGNMFDIEPRVDLTITCLNLNSRATAGSTASVDIYYLQGTSVGNEQNPSAWTMMGTYSFVSNGRGLASTVDISSNNVTFLANTTYGIYLDAGASGGLAYTNGGPTTYQDADLRIITNSGNATNFGTFFFPREWNGAIYYDAGPGIFSLSVSGLIAGSMTTLSTRNGTPNGNVGLGYSLAGPGPSQANVGGCGPLQVDLSPPIRIIGIVPSDASGNSASTLSVPPGTTGVNVWFQALDIATCTLSGGVFEVIG